MIEFGMGHDIWWQHHDQILLYVDALLQNQKKTSLNAASTSLDEELSNVPYTFDEPILLTIITVNQPTDNDETKDVRFGIFLCRRKKYDEDEYRISLLWRTETTLNDASTQLPRFYPLPIYARG